jgi:twinkle protein
MEAVKQESEFVKHLPCTNPDCNSSDGNSLYSDGHSYCFVCNTYNNGTNNDGLPVIKTAPLFNFVEGTHQSLSSRKITLESCQKWNYTVGTYGSEVVQIANYYNKNKQICFQKIRFKNKDFKTIGEIGDATLFGQNLWQPKGRIVCITEGEIDAISLSQIFNHKYPCVSIPNGTAGSVKSIKKNLEWLESFESVILFFDQDQQGLQASKDCAELFTVGKCKIASFELKDVNEMLVAGKTADVVKAMWQSKLYRPDGIIAGTELWELIKKPNPTATASYPFEGLNKKLFGLRKREIVTICGGSGIGKTLVTKELALHLINSNHKVGIISLEESLKRTCEGIIGLHLNKPIHINRDNLTDEELQRGYKETIGNGNVFLYDHWGSVEEDTILSKIKFFATGLDCEFLIVDHISIIVSGLEVYDERKTIDMLMTNIRKLAEQLNIGIILVSHLKRPEGNKDHTDGLKTSLGHLRGSASISQLSDVVLGVERSTSDESQKNLAFIRILKNRFSGLTGKGCTLKYESMKGRLVEHEADINF